ncbi:MAG: TlpA family protein disulfide reductase [Alphaproteobacteria bacterium]|nr:TlpA family protein disulfide reductase [Alphaproteobacteria bacterium]
MNYYQFFRQFYNLIITLFITIAVMMRKFLLILPIIALLQSFASMANAQTEGYDGRHPVFNGYLTDDAPKPVNLHHYRDNIVFLVFWATWCQRCVKQLKIMDSLYNAAENKKIIFLPINIDFRGVQLVQKAYESYGIKNLRPVTDEFGKSVKYMNVSVLPTTIVLDENGVTRKRIIGQRKWNIDYINRIILDVKESQETEQTQKIETFKDNQLKQ